MTRIPYTKHCVETNLIGDPLVEVVAQRAADDAAAVDLGAHPFRWPLMSTRPCPLNS